MIAGRRNFIKGLGTAALIPLVAGAAGGTGIASVKRSSHRVLSCNIRVALDEDEAKGVGWSVRREICLRVIDKYKPDIISLQEVLKVQADDFRKFFSSYQLFGFEGPEMDAHTSGYHGIAKNPLLFAKNRYELLAGGTYWLSETPLVAGSKSWNTARARHANWVRLKEKKTGIEFRLVNLHLDHISGEAKMQQAKMVVEENKQYQPGFARLMTGDFNTRYDSRVFEPVRAAGWKECYETLYGEKEAGFTGHEFEGKGYEKGLEKGRIDYIWYTDSVHPVKAFIIKDDVKGKYPSDHFFIGADVMIEP